MKITLFFIYGKSTNTKTYIQRKKEKKVDNSFEDTEWRVFNYQFALLKDYLPQKYLYTSILSNDESQICNYYTHMYHHITRY